MSAICAFRFKTRRLKAAQCAEKKLQLNAVGWRGQKPDMKRRHESSERSLIHQNWISFSLCTFSLSTCRHYKSAVIGGLFLKSGACDYSLSFRGKDKSLQAVLFQDCDKVNCSSELLRKKTSQRVWAVLTRRSERNWRWRGKEWQQSLNTERWNNWNN